MDAIELTIQNLLKWESSTDYLYLDSRKVNGVPAPLTTIGIGCAVGLQEALTLPFWVNVSPATQEQITADYEALQNAPFGYRAPYYEAFTECRLTPDGIDALCRSRLAVFQYSLEKTFPAFDSWPTSCQSGTLDLIYGLGMAGFEQYKLFIAAGNQNPPNFADMAAQCASNANIAAYDARNQARKLLFLQGVNP